MLSVEDRLAKLERLIEAQQATIEAQAARIAVLETENAELRRRLGANSSNSSKPPSSDSPADRAARPKDAQSGKARGGQPGHKGHKRTFLPISQVQSTTHCFPPQCRWCGDALPKRRDPDPLRRQVVDIETAPPDRRAEGGVGAQGRRCARGRARRIPPAQGRARGAACREQVTQLAVAGLRGPSKRDRKAASVEARGVRDLERELARKEQALAEAAALLILKEKTQAIWGDEDDDTTPENDE